MILYSKVIDSGTDPVTLDEAKTHLEVTGTSKDAFITALISSATKICEAYAGLSFSTCQRRILMDRFPCGGIIIPYGPVQSIDTFTYVDTDGSVQTLVENTSFFFDGNSDLARLFYLSEGDVANWPSTKSRPNAVTIEYTAGYDDISGTPLPPQVKTAILLQVGSMFENRQDEIVGTAGTAVGKLGMNSMAILDTIKVYWNASD